MTFRKTIALCVSLVVLAGCAVSSTLASSPIGAVVSDFLSGLYAKEDYPSSEDILETATMKIDLTVADDEGLLMPGRMLGKTVTVRNITQVPEESSTDYSVYVWLTCTVPSALVNLDDSSAPAPITINFAKDSGWAVMAPVYSDGKTYREVVDGDNVKWVEFTCIYSGPVAPGNVTQSCFESVSLHQNVSQTVDGGYFWTSNDGRTTPLTQVEFRFHAYAMSVEDVAVIVGAEGENSAEAAYNLFPTAAGAASMTAEAQG